jgi:hypothetical protein
VTYRSTLQIARFTSAGVWTYQGLVPKLLGPHADEVAMIAAPWRQVRA